VSADDQDVKLGALHRECSEVNSLLGRGEKKVRRVKGIWELERAGDFHEPFLDSHLRSSSSLQFSLNSDFNVFAGSTFHAV